MSATTCHVHGGVATITLAEPDNRNALSVTLVESLGAHLVEAVADAAVNRTVPELDRDSAFAMTQELSAALFASPEAIAGIAAFREKRPAPWVP